MDERRCGACGASEQPGAGFCPQCGVASGAQHVDLDEDGATQVLDVGQSGLAKVLVPLGVFALVGLLVVALIGAGGDDAPDPEARSPRPTAAAVPTGAPTPTMEATSTPMPITGPSAINAAVDPSALPPTDATHLAVAYGSTVRFLDLRTGTWTETDLRRDVAIWTSTALPYDVGGIFAFGDGVLVETQTDGPTFVLATTGTSRALGSESSYVIAVRGDLAFIQESAEPDRRVTAITPSGEVIYEVPLDTGMLAPGVTDDGYVVVQDGANIVLVSVKASQSLGTGVVTGVVGNKAVVYDCSGGSECRNQLLDTPTGERRKTALDAERANYVSNGDIVTYNSDGEATVFRLVDDELIQVPGLQFDSGPDRGLGFATDAAGLSARVVANQIEFIDDVGAVLTSIPFTPNICCDPPFGVTFIYADS